MKLSGKVAIVTGGGTGIGAAAARLFATEGARVCISGRRKEPLQETVAGIQAAGGTAMWVSGDVSKTEDCKRLVAETMAAWGRLDILVTSAGTAMLMPVTQITDELWDQILGINLKGTFLCVREALPIMAAQKSGSIIAVSSILGRSGVAGTAAYGASKAGLEQFIRVVSLECAALGVRANSLAPGWVETPMTDPLAKNPDLHRAILSTIPTGRFGTPDEIAHGILYLASDEARWVTGTVLIVDGGRTAQ
jgi:NAD(P)-dependent dehydrogenase (short-subunit alcohol dehydrogenase family)